MDAWQHMCDEQGEEDLVLRVTDVALTSGIRRKRPDAWAALVCWGRLVLYILEFTRPNDWADDWQTQTDAYKTERYTRLRDRIATLLPRWNIEIVTFSLGISDHDLKTRFHVRTWRGECMLTPLAFAVEIATFDFALVVSVLVRKAGINPSEPYVIDDLKRELHIRTNALTHLLARWGKNNNSIVVVWF